jgi:hypothetical protein
MERSKLEQGIEQTHRELGKALDTSPTTVTLDVLSYLDYMEERGYSSVRGVRGDLYQALRDQGVNV